MPPPRIKQIWSPNRNNLSVNNLNSFFGNIVRQNYLESVNVYKTKLNFGDIESNLIFLTKKYFGFTIGLKTLLTCKVCLKTPVQLTSPHTLIGVNLMIIKHQCL